MVRNLMFERIGRSQMQRRSLDRNTGQVRQKEGIIMCHYWQTKKIEKSIYLRIISVQDNRQQIWTKRSARSVAKP